MRRSTKLIGLPLAAVLGVLAAAPASAAPANIELISRSTTGGVAALGASRPILSATGRYIVFTSDSDDLLAHAPMKDAEAYLRDRQTGTVELISVNNDGVAADRYSGAADVSADGRYVLFSSSGTNLAPGTDPFRYQLYVRDRQAHTTTLVSKNMDGKPIAAQLSFARFSDDGRFLVFTTDAPDVVPGDTNGVSDVFVRDLVAGTTERVSLDVDNSQRALASDFASISATGRFVTYVASLGSQARRAVYLRDRATGVTEEVSLDHTGQRPDNPWGVEGTAPVSADGRYVAFNSFWGGFVPGDTNDAADIFVRDRVAGTTERVSSEVDGSQLKQGAGTIALTPDGRHLAFTRPGPWTPAGRATQVYLWSKRSGQVRKVTADGENQSWYELPAISDDGNTVAFMSESALVPDDTNTRWDVYVRTF